MKTRGIKEALLVHRDDGAIDICAPHIGQFTAGISPGAVVGGPVSLGEFRIGMRDWTLMLPVGVEGRVRELLLAARKANAQYKQVLLVLQPGALDQTEAQSDADTTALTGEAFPSPMDGQFYRRPSPDDDAFVNVGDVIEPGATLGLIEVMKFFYPVTFDGRQKVRVLSVLVDETGPVTSGDPLITFEAV